MELTQQASQHVFTQQAFTLPFTGAGNGKCMVAVGLVPSKDADQQGHLPFLSVMHEELPACALHEGCYKGLGCRLQ